VSGQYRADDTRKGVVNRDIPNARQDYGQNIGTPGPDELHDDRGDDVATFNPPPPLPAMPCSWWVRVVLGNPDDLVSAEDAALALRLVRAHLEATDIAKLHQEADASRLVPGEGGDSGNDDSRDAGPDEAVEYNVSLPITVGALHSAVEALGPNAWAVFVRCWQTACGIPTPPENRSLGRRFRPGAAPNASPSSQKPDDSATASHAVIPSLEVLRSMSPSPRPDAAIIEPGLLKALLEMPPKVAGFLLHQPKDPPPWVYLESEAERSQRQALEALGGWTG
jgi:hypothetical protein